MANGYGVYTTLEDGTESWVVTEMPLTLGTKYDAIDTYSMAEAITVSTYLTNTEGTVFGFGRPDDRHGKA